MIHGKNEDMISLQGFWRIKGDNEDIALPQGHWETQGDNEDITSPQVMYRIKTNTRIWRYHKDFRANRV